MVRFVASMCMLKYGDCADRLDDYLQLLETVSSDALKYFCRIVVRRFKAQYLNRPNTRRKRKCIIGDETKGVSWMFFIMGL